jgi:hypothetical protein
VKAAECDKATPQPFVWVRVQRAPKCRGLPSRRFAQPRHRPARPQGAGRNRSSDHLA